MPTKSKYSESDFLTDIIGSPGLRNVKKSPYCYSYNVEETRMNCDPFVRKSLKLWNSSISETFIGYSKRAELSVALKTLLKFKFPERLKSNDKSFLSAYEKALAKTRSVFLPSEPLYRISTPNACDTMHLDAAAGFSFPDQTKSECVEEAYDVASYIQHMVEHDKKYFVPPCKLAVRGHLSAPEQEKSRPVWVYPFEISILEAKWAIPFYQHLEQNVSQVHFGHDSMPRLAHMMMQGLADDFECVEVTNDWSAFDSSIPKWLMDDAFDIIWDSFDNSWTAHDGQLIHGGDIMIEKNLKLYNFIKSYFMFTKLMLPSGSLIAKRHGIPSGSFFTQSIGSIINYLVNTTVSEYFDLLARRLVVLGDDSSFLVPGFATKNLNVDKISNFSYRYFGLTLKRDKFRCTTKQSERKFIGYQCQGYRFTRPVEEWFTMVLFPERDVEFLEQSASRVIAYYIIGGVNDEWYCSFYRTYFRHYPQLHGQTVYLTKGLKRLFKYVLRLPVKGFKIADISEFDPSRVPYLLSLKDDMYFQV